MAITPKNHSVTDAKNIFLRIAEKMDKHYREQLEEAAKKIEDEAKRVLGTYDYGWPPLQPSTIARKVAGDTPLLETKKMQDSIEHYVPPSGPLAAYVGSNNPKARWQELGTIDPRTGAQHIPPRSFLMGAAMHKEKEIHEELGIKIHAKIVEDLTSQPKGAPDR